MQIKKIEIEIPDGKKAEWVDGVLTLVDDKQPQDITDRIKTLEDACKWCALNNYGFLVRQLSDVHFTADPQARDIFAYLKLRIITAALNEGWEPRCEQCEELWSVVYNWNNDRYCADWYRKQQPIPHKLALKSHELAEYAANQFRDIYADFCGCKKGGEG